MAEDRSNERQAPTFAGTLAAMLFAAASGVTAGAACAEPRDPDATLPHSRLAQLERAFWLCDHAATTRGVDGDTAMLCVALTDELKQSKFNGDFEKMLAWWRQHKPAEHARLERGEESLASR